jgi:hypothetical protein
MPEDRSQKSEARDGFWFGIFFRLSINEAELDAGIEVVLTSGFWLLTSATRHRLHIPFPIDNRGQKPEARMSWPLPSSGLLAF